MMTVTSHAASVKVAGANGQNSLGKQFAGRQVLIEEQEAGVWLIRTATVIPDNERWLHEPQAAVDLARALAWSRQYPASDARAYAVLKAVSQGKHADGGKRRARAPGPEQPGFSGAPAPSAEA